MSPELAIPKLMWLKRRMPETWSRAAHIADLADFLTLSASGNPARSHCTLASKWTYLGPGTPSGWQPDFLVLSEATFKDYIKDPRAKIPGTKMIFPGIKNEKEADDLWSYLQQFSADGKTKS